MADTVLVVDDSAAIRQMVRVFLMNAGFEFLESETGERALQLVRLMPVRLVIADVNMSGMDGLALTRAIRAEREPVSKIPVILMTGNMSADFNRQGLDAGANRLLYKPFTPQRLESAVREVLPR